MGILASKHSRIKEILIGRNGREGTNWSNKGLNLSRSWQQGHSVTTNTNHVFKSFVKESTHHSIEIVLQGGRCSTSIVRAWPMTCTPGGRKAPTVGQKAID
ncbi:Hypothetical predicted protein, partial [Olea europaea subsp. europaea]